MTRQKSWFGKAFSFWQALPSEAKKAQWEADRGNQFFVHGDYEEAIAAFSQAIQFSPNNAQNYLRRALARERKGQWEGALADYCEVMRRNPGLPECAARIDALQRKLRPLPT